MRCIALRQGSRLNIARTGTHLNTSLFAGSFRDCNARIPSMFDVAAEKRFKGILLRYTRGGWATENIPSLLGYCTAAGPRFANGCLGGTPLFAQGISAHRMARGPFLAKFWRQSRF
jgi:hypothetical protein